MMTTLAVGWVGDIEEADVEVVVVGLRGTDLTMSLVMPFDVKLLRHLMWKGVVSDKKNFFCSKR